ncbi:Uncharacterized protein DBV15_10106, partial [Temnothorax longispinosus]
SNPYKSNPNVALNSSLTRNPRDERSGIDSIDQMPIRRALQYTSVSLMHFVEVFANIISWSKVAPQTTTSSRNYAWKAAALTWRRFSNAVANGATLLLVTNEAYYALDVDFALQKRRVFARGTIGDCLSRIATICTRRSIRMPPIVSDIYDLYVSIRASKSNCMVVPVWRVIQAERALRQRDSHHLIKSH